MKELPYGPANLYRSPVWVPLVSDSEVLVQLQPLSHSTLASYNGLHYLKDYINTPHTTSTPYTMLADAIIDTVNAIGFPDTGDIVKQLPPEDIAGLYGTLLSLSITTDAQYNNLSKMLDVQFNESFSEDSWACAEGIK